MQISPAFFLQVMGHWSMPGIAGAVLGLSLLLLCSGPWSITLGVSTLFTGLMFSAGRFFGVNTTTQKTQKIRTKKINSASPSVLSEPDPLEAFLCLLYGATPEELNVMPTGADIAPDSRLIACVDEIKKDGQWGTELHLHYLAHLFCIDYACVRVSEDKQMYDAGGVSGLNPKLLDQQSFKEVKTVQLINHAGLHWVTMFGDAPRPNAKETRVYLNNPGEGDCLFYAFSLGLGRLMCEGIKGIDALKKTRLFNIWLGLDKNINVHGVCEAILGLGQSRNPMKDDNIKQVWFYFQRSLRYLVANHMVEQLKVEGTHALVAYQEIQKNRANEHEILTILFGGSPLYREFNMLYNLNDKTGREDSLTNIFSDCQLQNKLTAMMV